MKGGRKEGKKCGKSRPGKSGGQKLPEFQTVGERNSPICRLMFRVSSGRAGMRFAPTTSHPHQRPPHQPDLPENQYSYRPPPQPRPPSSHHRAPPTFHATLSPFPHSRVPIPILGSQLRPDFHPVLATLAALHISLSATLTPRPAFSPPSNPHVSILIQRPPSLSPPSFRLPSRGRRSLLLSHVPRGSLSLGRLGADSANHPYWLNDPLKIDTSRSRVIKTRGMKMGGKGRKREKAGELDRVPERLATGQPRQELVVCPIFTFG